MTRILIVDDSPTQISAISKILLKQGFEIITAEDGETGVEKASSEKPDIILMDVVMPNLNGFQATRQITRNPDTSHIPVIILTSKDQETDKAWAMRQGAKHYLVKPVTQSELLAKVAHELRRGRGDLMAAAGVLTIVPGALVIWFVRNYMAKGFALGRV